MFHKGANRTNVISMFEEQEQTVRKRLEYLRNQSKPRERNWSIRWESVGRVAQTAAGIPPSLPGMVQPRPQWV